MKISIVTPSFNQADFIESTIESVLSQKGDIEYFVIDGGSTDRTIEILKKYKKKYKNFHYVSEKDDGQSDAINKGLKMCTGDIMAYINSDDVYEPGAFEKVHAFFKNNPDIYWGYGHYSIINEKDRPIRKFFSKYKNFAGRSYSYSKLLRINIVPQPSTFWRKEIYAEFGGFDKEHHLVMDYEYWCRIGKKYPAKQIKHPTAQYRFYTDSKSGANFKIQYKKELEVAKMYAAKKYPFSIFAHKINYIIMTALFRVLRLLGK